MLLECSLVLISNLFNFTDLWSNLFKESESSIHLLYQRCIEGRLQAGCSAKFNTFGALTVSRPTSKLSVMVKRLNADYLYLNTTSTSVVEEEVRSAFLKHLGPVLWKLHDLEQYRGDMSTKLE